MGCPLTPETNIITHCGMVGAKSLQQSLYTSQATEFMIRINDPHWNGESTRLRLMFTQLQLGLNERLMLTSYSRVHATLISLSTY